MPLYFINDVIRERIAGVEVEAYGEKWVLREGMLEFGRDVGPVPVYVIYAEIE